MISIIDYGMGNLGSIKNMVKKAGYAAEISSDVQHIGQAEKIILPGVGSFDRAMSNLNDLGLTALVQQKAADGTPLLGICLGMQLLAESSEEGILGGLGLVPGKVLKFDLPADFKVPHMGWNVVEYNSNCLLFRHFEGWEEARFYFVHSYYFDAEAESSVTGKTPYGRYFASSVNKGNVYGVQFHPEKSHKFGMQLLKNFIELA